MTLQRVRSAIIWTPVTDALREPAIRSKRRAKSMTVRRTAHRNRSITTEPYPGFPTDMQAQMCALLSHDRGISVITENIFPQRYMHVAELKRMGARYRSSRARRAIIKGVERTERRAGHGERSAGLRRAGARGIAAEGATEVNRVYHIDRGYELIDEKLNGLGAHIERVKVKG